MQELVIGNDRAYMSDGKTWIIYKVKTGVIRACVNLGTIENYIADARDIYVADDKATINNGRRKMSFPCRPDEPKWPLFEGSNWRPVTVKDQKQLKHDLQICLKSSTKANINPAYAGVLFAGPNCDLVTTDIHRLTVKDARDNVTFEGGDFVINGDDLKAYFKMQPAEVYVNDKHVKFENDKKIYIAPLLKNEFPKWRNVFDYNEPLPSVQFKWPKEAFDICREIKKFCGKDKVPPVRLTGENTLDFYTENEAGESFAIESNIEVPSAIKTAANVRYVLDIEQKNKDVTLCLSEGLRPLVFFTPEDKLYQLVMPLRI